MKIATKKLIIILSALLLSVNLFGCTKTLDITERSIVTGVGIDKSGNGDIELTLQIVNPAGLGTTQEGTSASIQPIWINCTNGETVFEALKKQLKTVSRRPFFNHVQVLVIGKRLARDGIGDVLDFFSRNSEARLTPKVIIAKQTTAKQIICAKSIMETIPAMHLRDILENNKQNGFVPDPTIFDVLKGLSDNVTNIAIGVAEFKGGGEELIKDIWFEHAAVFNRDKLVDWLDISETTGLAYVKNQINKMDIGIKDPIDEKNRLVINQKSSKGKIHVEFQNERPRAHINIKADGIIIEQFGQTVLMTEGRLREIEKEVENTIKENIRALVYKAQNELNSDILGIGDIIHKRHLKYWRQLEDNWREVFSSMPIEVNVRFQIKETGLTGPPNKLY